MQLKSSGKTEVLKKAGVQSMHTILKLAQLRWTGHVIRMPGERQKESLLWRTTGGYQKKRYKDTPKASLKDFDIPMGSSGQTVQGAIKVARSHHQRSSFL